jgi:2-oxoglutarate dehydrogenase E2 component (dihydrolipoamide succinyltransferase)
MSEAIKVPAVGESIVEGTIARWLKKDGDWVQADEPLFELETEKATTTVPAQATGALHVTVPEGATVAIGAVVGQIDPPAQRPSATAPAKPPVSTPAKSPEPAPAATKAPPLLSPAAQRLVEEKKLSAQAIPGTGRGGRVTKEDVVTYVEAQAPSAAGPSAAERQPSAPAPLATAPATDSAAPRETRQRISAIRQRISERLLASQNSTATLTTFNEADMSAVLALRARFKEKFQQRHGVGLGLMSFFVRACVEGLRAFPILNARIEGNEIVTPHSYNIGVAVSTERGLMVPVIQAAERLSFAEIEKAIAALADKARAGTIAITDLQGGTFTITNGGVFGSLLSTPILNPPQSAILGMHTIQKRPVAVEDQVVIRPMMYLAVSYDHRLIDGREAVQFLVRIKECIEAPERLLLEV